MPKILICILNYCCIELKKIEMFNTEGSNMVLLICVNKKEGQIIKKLLSLTIFEIKRVESVVNGKYCFMRRKSKVQRVV
jgi:hypothetical protein